MFSMRARRWMGGFIGTFSLIKGLTNVEYTKFFKLAESDRTRAIRLSYSTEQTISKTQLL